MRRQSLQALLLAWKNVATIDKITAAAEKVGLRPFNPEKPLESEFVRKEGNEEDGVERVQQHVTRELFSINNKEITRPEIIEAIKSKISAPIDFPLCRRFTEFHNNLCEVAVFYAREAKLRKVIQLTVISPILGSVH